MVKDLSSFNARPGAELTLTFNTNMSPGGETTELASIIQTGWPRRNGTGQIFTEF